MQHFSVFQAFSLEAIARCAFSMDSESQKNENDLFLSIVRNFFKIGNFARRSFVLMVAGALSIQIVVWNKRNNIALPILNAAYVDLGACMTGQHMTY